MKIKHILSIKASVPMDRDGFYLQCRALNDEGEFGYLNQFVQFSSPNILEFVDKINSVFESWVAPSTDEETKP